MSLTDSQAAAAAGVSFQNGADIVSFFQSTAGDHYIDWFNQKCAGKQSWAGKQLGASDAVKTSFLQIWNNIPDIFGDPSIDLVQFVALMSILTNEVGAELQPVAEFCGSQGLAYPFDAIPGKKRSYNSTEGNRLAGDLFFDDDEFWKAHGGLAPANNVRNRPELKAAWNGTAYPTTDFSPAIDKNTTAFIQQADFYKFRGRGLIQMTWRTNYTLLVKYIQNYPGAHPTIVQFKSTWGGKDPDMVCTISTNDDWDTLFQQTDLVVASRAVGLHNEAPGNQYLKLARDAATLTAMSDVMESFYRMGLKISGGNAYAALFTNRVIQVLTTLNYLG
ncbi:MAG TPA: hypothetical protein VHZ07_24505 [Bryobacteraceae bacterium]|jgi:hypothetical protein|nr:hypothetical protein [Bryobacteraceae bacterium]